MDGQTDRNVGDALCEVFVEADDLHCVASVVETRRHR